MKRILRGKLFQPLGFAVLAGLAGVALNRVPAVGLAQLWPGRVLTLAVAIVFGPWFGALAALIVAPSAYAVNGSLMAVFGIEAILIGVFARRGKPPLVAALIVATLFTLMGALFPGSGAAPLQSAMVPLALQRLLNLMVAPVLADFIVAAASARGLLGTQRPHQHRQLRAHFFRAFVLVAIVPVLLLSTITGQVFATKQETEGGERLRDVAGSLGDHINQYLNTHMRAVEALAVTVSQIRDDPDEQTQVLERYSRIYDGFRGLAIDDPAGGVRELLLVPASVTTNRRLSVADRQYFKDAVRTRRAAISDIVMGRTTPPEPSVFIGAPFFDRQGALAGAVHVSLKLSQLQALVDAYQTVPDATVTILDRQRRVIYASSRSGYQARQDLSQEPLVRERDRTADRIFQYTPIAPAGRLATQLAADAPVEIAGWTVVVARPLLNTRLQTSAYYLSTLGLILVALVGAILGARAFGDTVTRPLEELVAIVRNVSAHGTQVPALVSPNPPAEIAALVDDVNGMQLRLADSYRQVEQALGEREQLNHDLRELTGQLDLKVRERTAELADANAVLGDIFRALPGALFVADQAGTIRLFNDTAATLLGRSVTGLSGLSIAEVFDAADPLPIAEIQALKSQGSVLRAERLIVTGSGERIPTLVSATVFPDGDGNVAGLRTVCIAIDIRDRKKLEVELHQAQKLESVGRLAAGVAHEINTPVQFVSDSVHFIREAMGELAALIQRYRGVPTSAAEAAALAQAERDADLDYLLENVPKALDRSLDGLNRVAVIVRSMKEFAHPDQREMTSVDLNQAIQSTLVIARNEYKYVADVETDYGDIPRVTCYAGDINQVILNIVVNAAHAIGEVVSGTEARGRITVQTRRDGDSVVVSIRDTGRGIPEAIRGQIFDPFFTTKDVGKGTGQGLAIARSVVSERHGGELTFESETGQGAAFFIRLPIDGKRPAGIAA